MTLHKLRTEMKRKLWNGSKKMNARNNGRRLRRWKRVFEQKRVDEGVRQVEVLQKVPELVAHQRTSQCKKVEGPE